MPRRNPLRPLPLSKWTAHERERGYRWWIDHAGREMVQCAPGRTFRLVDYPRIGARVVEEASTGTLMDLFRAPVPRLGVVQSNDPELGIVIASGMVTEVPDDAGPHADTDVPDYGEDAPEPRPPLIGPVSAEFLAYFVGFNAGRGERFLRAFVSTGLIRARRVPGRTRIWEFEEASLSHQFPGKDWARMMEEYRVKKTRPATRGKYKPEPTDNGSDDPYSWGCE